jgi:hypothetical protein
VDAEAGGARQWAQGEGHADHLAVAGAGHRGGRVLIVAKGGERLVVNTPVYHYSEAGRIEESG